MATFKKYFLQVKKFFSKWLILFLLALLLALETISSVDSYKEKAMSEYYNQVNMIDQRMMPLFWEVNNFPSGAGNDVLFLNKLDSVKNNGNGSSTQSMLNDFYNFIKQNQVYYQVSYADYSGQEIAKVFFTEDQIEESPSEDLKNIKDSDLFKKATSVGQDRVAISELKKEVLRNGKSEAIIDYASPVYSNVGELTGVVILSVRAAYFLDDVRNFARVGEDAMLIDSAGRYLASQNQSKEFDQTGKYNFFNDYPDAAAVILRGTNNYSVEDDKHIFSFRKIVPVLSKFEIYEGSLNSGQSTADDYWVLIVIGDKTQIFESIYSIIKEKAAAWLFQTFVILLIATILWRRNIKDVKKTRI